MIYVVCYISRDAEKRLGLFLQWARTEEKAIELAKDPNMYIGWVVPMNTIKTLIGIFVRRRIIT